MKEGANTFRCQCEHREHFDGTKHPYGLKLEAHNKVEVKTDFGTYELCPACARYCFGQFQSFGGVENGPSTAVAGES